MTHGFIINGGLKVFLGLVYFDVDMVRKYSFLFHFEVEQTGLW
jgi:hypothetical protein